ncbi:MAG: prepilin-type N-terminal cleavage/methylation domain-containing protein [Candidatus Omnitrophota bacterium]|nr:prepilin-type N-terminal cleavage/methylation domain-containing protein [Candidatus Omnitrophota bacterium]
MNKHGFTLVEVLIVVIILGILASIGIPQFAASIEKAKGGEARAGLGHIQTGEKVYFAEQETYVTNAAVLDISLSQKYWTFAVSVPDSTHYTAIATRLGGTCEDQVITLDQDGTIDGNWRHLD